MKRQALVVIATTIVFVGGFLAYQIFGGGSMKVLKVGYPEYWGENMSPSLQHTIYADAMLANQFESLVSIGPAGSIKPQAAKEWKASDDKRVYTFKIDTSKRFSNGKNLSAQDFKDSWEYGLALDPKSANSSLQDILYKVVGFEDFARTKQLNGLRVIDNETLEIEFKNSFRAALTNLAGSRMAAFVIENGKILGTGPYVIEETEDKKLVLTANPFQKDAPPFREVHVEVVKPELAQQSLDSGLIDVYSLAEHAEFNNCLDDRSSTGCFAGNESRHITMVLNSKGNRIFNKRENRLAMQSLFYQTFSGKEMPAYMRIKTELDPQIFLPLQSGRIEDEDAMNHVEAGAPYVDSFIKETQKKPIKIVTGTTGNLLSWVKDGLSKRGVRFSEDSDVLPMKDLAATYYKTHDTDIALMTLSVASGDPDGIYHALGSQGAITSPMMFKKESASLLEDGRKILELDRINEHYQKVTTAALSEVPFVHLGYLKTLMVYRKDKVKLEKEYKQREDNRFSSFGPL